jgi:hypothetical protein
MTRNKKNPGFLLEFIPVKTGAGMTPPGKNDLTKPIFKQLTD